MATQSSSPGASHDGIKRVIFGGNVYNTPKFAGAFGDLGTLIPFVVGYIVVSKIDPVGILVSLGILKIFVGLYFKTPVPIQPMKAIGAAAIGIAFVAGFALYYALQKKLIKV